MISKILSVGVPLVALVCSAYAQDVQRLDASANKIVPESAHLERILTGFDKWTEGPVWVRGGALLFAEIPANNIDRWAPGEKATVFIHPSGYLGTKPYGGPEPGSNGMTLDPSGKLTVAGHARRNVWRLEAMNPSAQITVLADTFEGKRLNSPNDLVYKSDGSLYFTDPPYGLRTQGDNDPEKELKVNGVYRIPNATRQKAGAPPDRGSLQLLIRDLPRPNGIAFSPDEKYLYVSDSQKRVWMKYSVMPDGSVGDGALFLDTKGAQGSGGPDGIKVDTEGNLYGAGPGGVWIISPEGKHLVTIHVPETVGNLAWGDKAGKMLYITASTSVYRIHLNNAGKLPGR